MAFGISKIILKIVLERQTSDISVREFKLDSGKIPNNRIETNKREIHSYVISALLYIMVAWPSA